VRASVANNLLDCLLVTLEWRIERDPSMAPVMLERVDAEQKERFGQFLRVVASTGQVDVIVIISEA